MITDLARTLARRIAGRREAIAKHGILHAIASTRWLVPGALQGRDRYYLSYRPDWDYDFDRLSEVRELSHRWVARNEKNNSGDASRLYALVLNLNQVVQDGVPGDFAELGVYRGNSAAVLARFAEAADRSLYLFDTFSGFDARDVVGIDATAPKAFEETSIELVKQTVASDKAVYVPGFFPQTVTSEIAGRRYAIVHLDCDLYEPMKAGLEFFYPRLSEGGLMIMHDYSNPHWEGAKMAVDEFAATVPEQVVLIPDKSGTAMFRKAVHRNKAKEPTEAGPTEARGGDE